MLVPSRFLNSATLYGAGQQVGFEDFMGSNYHRVNIQKAIENCPLIVDLPINSMVIFHSYVSLPEGIFSISYSVYLDLNHQSPLVLQLLLLLA